MEDPSPRDSPSSSEAGDGDDPRSDPPGNVQNATEQASGNWLFDPLTALPSRMLFMERLEQCLADRRNPGPITAVFYVDIDHFKDINDNLGYEAGDELLLAVAKRLQDTLRPADTVARLTADKFGLVLDDLSDIAQAMTVAFRMTNSLEEPLKVAQLDIFVTASIGIALQTEQEENAELLLAHALEAKNRAKDKGDGGCEVFHAGLAAEALERLNLEEEIRRAVDDDELSLRYQPLVRISDREVIGAEALVRWEHPTRGTLAPIEFFPLAEATGLIVPLGKFVLDRVCRQARAWQEEGATSSGMRINVNLSPKQLLVGDVLSDVAEVLSRSGLESDSLVLEVAESAVLDNLEMATKLAIGLDRLGVQLAIDDFGKDLNAIDFVLQCPIRALKLNRALVDGVETQENSRAVIRHICSLAHERSIRVTAVGVETEGQLKQLDALGCDVAQGFLFHRPMSGEDVA
ncbi:MAG: bifunctional diguanylate cyclase/phosphodiesterase, partial [Actinomycetota bacterium]|nr:bifunctional diguanylate cyclase/phosphodiesterase [Actinomycetota bacterium]